jgi:hypothetical protein
MGPCRRRLCSGADMGAQVVAGEIQQVFEAYRIRHLEISGAGAVQGAHVGAAAQTFAHVVAQVRT